MDNKFHCLHRRAARTKQAEINAGLADFTCALPSFRASACCSIRIHECLLRPDQTTQLVPGLRAHVAIIHGWKMAVGQPQRGASRLFRCNHAAAKRVREIVEACPDFGVEYLTIFASRTDEIGKSGTQVRGLRASWSLFSAATLQKKPGALKAKACGFAFKSGPCASWTPSWVQG